MAQVFLHVSKQTYGTREGGRHGPEFTKNLVAVLMLIRLWWVGMADRFSLRRSAWWVVSHSVMLTVSPTRLRST